MDWRILEMVSKFDMVEYIRKNVDRLSIIYKEDDDAIYDKETGEYLSSLDTFLDSYRKNTGQSFESVYYEHVALFSVIRCTECGTVIFTYEDESYDPHLKCPVCTDYKTDFEFWTKEDIDSDETKQAAIKHYKEMTDYQIEQDKRIQRRKGKYDWQIAVKKFYGKKYSLSLSLECDDITKSYFKGLRLDVNIGQKEKEDDIGYIIKHFFTIPLSWSQFYTQFIYRHLGKCHPDLRSKWYIGKAREIKL